MVRLDQECCWIWRDHDGDRRVYFFLGSVDLPNSVEYAGTAATGIIVGGSSLYVARRSLSASDSVLESGEKPESTRVTEVIVSVTVLSALTVLLGSIGGVGLTILARLGAPGPKTPDGELFRNRLLT